MASLVKEFREFAVRGNVIDLAVGVIIGAAFGKIVASLVDDVIMPPINLLIGTGQYASLGVVLRDEVRGADGAVQKAAIVLKYGHFLQTVLDFLIVAVAIFLLVRSINRFRRKQEAAPEPEAPPAPTREESLLMEIRDALRNRPV